MDSTSTLWSTRCLQGGKGRGSERRRGGYDGCITLQKHEMRGEMAGGMCNWCAQEERCNLGRRCAPGWGQDQICGAWPLTTVVQLLLLATATVGKCSESRVVGETTVTVWWKRVCPRLHIAEVFKNNFWGKGNDQVISKFINKKEKQCSHQKRRRRKFKYRQGCIYEAGVWRDGFGARDVLHGPNYMHDIQATNPKKIYFHTLSEKKEAPWQITFIKHGHSGRAFRLVAEANSSYHQYE